MRFLLLTLLVACGDNTIETTPDAMTSTCCDLWPDVNAIQSCAAIPHACGVLRCETPDGPKLIGACGVTP